MGERDVPGIETIFTPWRHVLLNALFHVRHRLLIVSPYIKEAVVAAMQQELLASASERGKLDVRVITRIIPDDLLTGSSDIAALQKLLAWSRELPDCTVEMRVISNVHAKVWVCDTALAIVGSGNATPSGLDTNLEYGLAVSETQLVEHILSDWQSWWDQAEVISAETLDEIAQALQLVKQSEAVRRSREQQTVLRRELKTIPQVGKRLTFKQEQQPAVSMIKDQPAAFSTAPYGQLTAIHQAYTSAILTDFTGTAFAQHAITVPVADFWHALRWVLPLGENTDNTIMPGKPHDAFLKIFWKATPSDHQQVQFIWADGKRYSQASLPAHCTASQQSWAITLASEQVAVFKRMIQELEKEKFFTKNADQSFYLLLYTQHNVTLSIAYQRNPANRWSGRAMVLPCTSASIPGNFPTLRAPLSQMTIEHLALRDAVLSLQREWDALYSQERVLSIIEFCLTKSETATPSITLSTGQIEAAMVRTLASKDCTIVGREARIRFDFMALLQIVAEAHPLVQSWQLRIDRYAEAIQFLPDPNAIDDETLLWRHELRGL